MVSMSGIVIIEMTCEKAIPLDAVSVSALNLDANIITIAALGAAAGITHEVSSIPVMPIHLNIARQISGTAISRTDTETSIGRSLFLRLNGAHDK